MEFTGFEYGFALLFAFLGIFAGMGICLIVRQESMYWQIFSAGFITINVFSMVMFVDGVESFFVIAAHLAAPYVTTMLLTYRILSSKL